MQYGAINHAGTAQTSLASSNEFWTLALSNSGAGVAVRLTPGISGQMHLHPAEGNHPPSGEPGDVFVDASARLWFCKGGANWKKVKLV